MNISFNRNDIERYSVIAQILDFLEIENNIIFERDSLDIIQNSDTRYSVLCNNIIDDIQFDISIRFVVRDIDDDIDLYHLYRYIDVAYNENDKLNTYRFDISYNNNNNVVIKIANKHIRKKRI
jgi:hypothetical protein